MFFAILGVVSVEIGVVIGFMLYGFSDLRTEIRAIWNEVIGIRERLTRIETSLGLAPITKEDKKAS
jgi:hypothetical protein